MLQELIDYRFVQYEARLLTAPKVAETPSTNVVELITEVKQAIPYFADLKIACGHFKTSNPDTEDFDTISLPMRYGRLDPKRHFVAHASGNSMNGGKHPIKDGDLLLLERLSAEHAGSISGLTMAIERFGAAGDDKYLLRNVKKIADQQYQLIAQNPDYEPIDADENMHTLAFLKDIIAPEDVNPVNQSTSI